MSYHTDALQVFHLLIVAYTHGEEQLVVLAAVQRAGGHVQIQLLGHHGGLVVDGQVLFVDAAAATALVADVQQLAAQTVADVHHRRGADAVLTQQLDDVAAGLALQLTLQQVFLPGKVGLKLHQLVQLLAMALAAGLGHLLIVDGFLALQQLQAQIGGTEVAAHTHQVGVLGAVAVHDVVLCCLTDTGDTDGQSGERGSGVAAHYVHAPFVAGHAQALVEVVQVFHLESLAQRYAHQHLTGGAVHGEDIADVHHGRLIAQMFHVVVGQVEVDAFHQHVGRDEYLAVGVVHHGAVVARGLDGRFIVPGQVFRQAPYQSKLSQFCYFHIFFYFKLNL